MAEGNRVLVAAMVLTAWAPRPAAQETLQDSVEAARRAWLAHNVEALVGSGDAIRLRLPGRDASPPLPPRQAARLLDEYLRPSAEIAIVVMAARQVDEAHGYAELGRRYVVRGTSEETAVTVFLGFRRVEGRWRLTEVRVGG